MGVGLGEDICEIFSDWKGALGLRGLGGDPVGKITL